MQPLTIQIPENHDPIQIRQWLLALLVEKGILSSGQAAEQPGISRRQFLEKAGTYGTSVFGETAEDLQYDID